MLHSDRPKNYVLDTELSQFLLSVRSLGQELLSLIILGRPVPVSDVKQVEEIYSHHPPCVPWAFPSHAQILSPP